MELERQLELNDPSLARLKIGSVKGDIPYPTDGDWERVGRAAGNTSHLVELNFGGDFRSSAFLFFKGAAQNRSIKVLKLIRCCHFDGREFYSLLVPFFQNNHNFDSLELLHCNLSPQCCHLLSSGLSSFNSLKIFKLNGCVLTSTTAKEIVEALAGHTKLRTISMRSQPAYREGCRALSMLLGDGSYANLLELNLEQAGIKDEVAAYLGEAVLAGNRTLSISSLNLGCNPGILIAGWKAIFFHFASSAFQLSIFFHPEKRHEPALPPEAPIRPPGDELALLRRVSIPKYKPQDIGP